MKLTLPVFMWLRDKNKILASCVLLGESEYFIINCHDEEAAKNIEGKCAFVTFNTNDFHNDKFENDAHCCLDFSDIKSFIFVKGEQVDEWVETTSKIFAEYFLVVDLTESLIDDEE